ncbi:unnamed protein product [Linum trigynum]|uniref:Uncharacterized protein n=1 Tax=Linum trigynum TaxID=586398 RepID=A0AAV2FER0_9ROSI
MKRVVLNAHSRQQFFPRFSKWVYERGASLSLTLSLCRLSISLLPSQPPPAFPTALEINLRQFASGHLRTQLLSCARRLRSIMYSARSRLRNLAPVNSVAEVGQCLPPLNSKNQSPTQNSPL